MKEIMKNNIHTNFENLPSVGSAISNFGFIYPLNADGSVDTFCRVDLDDASDEWLSALSEADAAIVNKCRKFTCWNCAKMHPVKDERNWGFDKVCRPCEDHLFDEDEERQKRRHG